MVVSMGNVAASGAYLVATHGVELTSAAAIASLVFIGNGLGGVSAGWLSDRLRRRRLPMLLWGATCVGSQLAYLSIPSLPLTTVAMTRIPKPWCCERNFFMTTETTTRLAETSLMRFASALVRNRVF